MLVEVLSQLAASKIFVGCCMFFMNIGSRYLIADLNDFHDKLLNNTIAKTFVIFCILFVATRDIVVSSIITCILAILLFTFTSKTSSLSILPYFFKHRQHGTVSAEDYKTAIDVIQQFRTQQIY
jgi:hypothetical protein